MVLEPAGGVGIGTDWPSVPFTTNNVVLWNGLNWSEGIFFPPSGDFVRMTNVLCWCENDGIVGQCQYQSSYKAGTACYNGISFTLGNDLPTGCVFHRGGGTNVANAWFVGGQSLAHQIIMVVVLPCQVVLPVLHSHI